MILAIVLLVIVIILVLICIGIYNGLVGARNQTKMPGRKSTCSSSGGTT